MAGTQKEMLVALDPETKSIACLLPRGGSSGDGRYVRPEG